MKILRRSGSLSEMTSLYECPVVISPVDLITHVARLDQDRKKSLVFRLVDALLNKESQRQPEATDIMAEEGQVDLKEEKNKQNTNIFEDATNCTEW